MQVIRLRLFLGPTTPSSVVAVMTAMLRMRRYMIHNCKFGTIGKAECIDTCRETQHLLDLVKFSYVISHSGLKTGQIQVNGHKRLYISNISMWRPYHEQQTMCGNLWQDGLQQANYWVTVLSKHHQKDFTFQRVVQRALDMMRKTAIASEISD